MAPASASNEERNEFLKIKTYFFVRGEGGEGYIQDGVSSNLNIYLSKDV